MYLPSHVSRLPERALYDAVAENRLIKRIEGNSLCCLLSGAAVQTANDNAGRHKNSGIHVIFVDEFRPGLKGSDRVLSPN